MTVSLKLYLELAFGNSFNFLPLNFNSPLKWASSSILSKDLVNWLCICPLIFVANTAMSHCEWQHTHWFSFYSIVYTLRIRHTTYAIRHTLWLTNANASCEASTSELFYGPAHSCSSRARHCSPPFVLVCCGGCRWQQCTTIITCFKV